MQNNDMTDKELHEFVKQTFSGYEPTYEPEHWGVMQDILHKNKRKRRFFFLAFMSIIIFFSLFIFNHLKQFDNKITSKIFFNQAMKLVPKSEGEIKKQPEYVSTLKIKKQPEQKKPAQKIVQKQEARVADEQIQKLIVKPILRKEMDFNFSFSLKDTIDFRSYFVEQKIRSNIKSNFISSDSTVYKIFQRNIHQWKNAIVICDWTSSMYEYGSQVLVLLNQLQQENYIKGFVFFNDCDSLGNQAAKDKAKYYHTPSIDFESVIQQMTKAVKYGKANQDYAENDLGAVVFAMQQFPDAEHFILIADNKSAVKDMHLLNQIKKPLKIVLCGETFFDGEPIQPDYQAIAKRTKSSLHTIENDIPSLQKLKNKSRIRIQNTLWKYKNGIFKRLK